MEAHHRGRAIWHEPIAIPSEIDNALRVVGCGFEFLIVNRWAVLPLFRTNIPTAPPTHPDVVRPRLSVQGSLTRLRAH